jgi:hypothetical protein
VDGNCRYEFSKASANLSSDVVVFLVPGTNFAASSPAPSSDEFATGYSLAGCTPAELASASPAVIYRDGAAGGCQELLAADELGALLMVLSWARFNGRF